MLAHSSINRSFVMCQAALEVKIWNILHFLLSPQVEDRWETNLSFSLITCSLHPHSLTTQMWLPLGWAPAASFDSHSFVLLLLHPTSAQSAPEALSLYPLQNAVAALHGYKGESSPPPTSLPYFSPHHAGERVCYLALPSVLLWPDYRFTRVKSLLCRGLPRVVKYTSQTLRQLHGRCPFSVWWQISSYASASSRFECARSFAWYKPPTRTTLSSLARLGLDTRLHFGLVSSWQNTQIC